MKPSDKLDEFLGIYGKWLTYGKSSPSYKTARAKRAAFIDQEILKAKAEELKSWLSAYQDTTGLAADPFILALSDRIAELIQPDKEAE